MASHHDGVTRLLKPWWPKMIEPKTMSPSQWLAIEDGPDMAGWYIYYDENGLATLEEYWAGLWLSRVVDFVAPVDLHRCLYFAPNGVSTCHWLNKSKYCTHTDWKTSAERMFVIDHVNVKCWMSLTMFACTLLFMFCLSCFVHVCGTLFFTCFTCCDMDLTTQVWWRLPRLPWQSDASGRWHGKKGLLRVSVHAVSVHTVVDDDCHWQ